MVFKEAGFASINESKFTPFMSIFIAVKNDITLQNNRICVNGFSIGSHNFSKVFQLEGGTEIIKFN